MVRSSLVKTIIEAIYKDEESRLRSSLVASSDMIRRKVSEVASNPGLDEEKAGKLYDILRNLSTYLKDAEQKLLADLNGIAEKQPSLRRKTKAAQKQRTRLSSEAIKSALYKLFESPEYSTKGVAPRDVCHELGLPTSTIGTLAMYMKRMKKGGDLPEYELRGSVYLKSHEDSGHGSGETPAQTGMRVIPITPELKRLERSGLLRTLYSKGELCVSDTFTYRSRAGKSYTGRHALKPIKHDIQDIFRDSGREYLVSSVDIDWNSRKIILRGDAHTGYKEIIDAKRKPIK